MTQMSTNPKQTQEPGSPATFDPLASIYTTANAQEVLNTVLEHLMGDHDGDYPNDTKLDALAPSLKASIMHAVQEEARTPCDHVYTDIENLARDVQELLPSEELQAIREAMRL